MPIRSAFLAPASAAADKARRSLYEKRRTVDHRLGQQRAGHSFKRRQAASRGPRDRQAVRVRHQDRDQGRDHRLRPRLRSTTAACRRGGGEENAGRRFVRVGLAHLHHDDASRRRRRAQPRRLAGRAQRGRGAMDGAGAPGRHDECALYGAGEARSGVAAGRRGLQGAGRALQSERRDGGELAHQSAQPRGAIRARRRPRRHPSASARRSSACGMRPVLSARSAPTSFSRIARSAS